jgi:quercetinase-like protein
MIPVGYLTGSAWAPAPTVFEIGCGPRGSQDASVYIARLEAGAEVIHPLGDARGAYVYLVDGAASLDDE